MGMVPRQAGEAGAGLGTAPAVRAGGPSGAAFGRKGR